MPDSQDDLTIHTGQMGRHKASAKHMVTVISERRSGSRISPPARGVKEEERTVLLAIKQTRQEVFNMDKRAKITAQMRSMDIDDSKLIFPQPQEAEETGSSRHPDDIAPDTFLLSGNQKEQKKNIDDS